MRLWKIRLPSDHSIQSLCSWKALQCLQNKLVWNFNLLIVPRSPPLVALGWAVV